MDIDGPRAVFDLDGRGDQEVLREALRRGDVRSFAPLVPSLDAIFKEVIR